MNPLIGGTPTAATLVAVHAQQHGPAVVPLGSTSTSSPTGGAR